LLDIYNNITFGDQTNKILIMKKITLFITVLFFINQGFAQDEGFGKVRRGSLTLDGSIYGNVNSYSYDNTDYSSFEFRFNPSFGVFVASNFEIGLSLSEGYSKSTYDYHSGSYTSTTEFTESLTGLSFYSNVYFGSGRIKPFVGAGLGVFVANSTTKTTYDNTDDSALELGFDLNGGIAIFLNHAVSLNIMLDYTRTSFSTLDDSENSDNNYGINSIYFGTGIRVYLPRD
jgi:hypothetical protein